MRAKEEVKKRIVAASIAYFALNKILKIRLTSITIKFRNYKTLIRPIITDIEREIWTLNKLRTDLLDRF